MTRQVCENSQPSAVHTPCLAEQRNVCSSQRRSGRAPRNVSPGCLQGVLPELRWPLCLHGPGRGAGLAETE